MFNILEGSFKVILAFEELDKQIQEKLAAYHLVALSAVLGD